MGLQPPRTKKAPITEKAAGIRFADGFRKAVGGSQKIFGPFQMVLERLLEAVHEFPAFDS